MKWTRMFCSMILVLIACIIYIGCVPSGSDTDKHTVTFRGHDGSVLKTEKVEDGGAATAPTAPPRMGYTFTGWDRAFDNVTESIIVIALYSINAYHVIYYEEDGITVIQTTAYDYGVSLIHHVEPDMPDKIGFTPDEWQALPNFMPAADVTRTASYQEDATAMTRVGSSRETYTFPTGTNDSGAETQTGGYLVAQHETTYALWYEVRIWAEGQGYHFQNQGREGATGVLGAAPTTASQEPVTEVSWRDAIVWLNALSEKYGFDPVYRTTGDAIIKDSRDANAAAVDIALMTNHNGYRLPTTLEWEMAARWKGDSVSTDGSILLGGRYWTPGNYASGATDDYQNGSATQLVAWYWDNSDQGDGNKTHPVGERTPNHLGIYDMNGNVSEWTFTASGSSRIARGGEFSNVDSAMQVGNTGATPFPQATNNSRGFRIVRNP